MNARGGLVGNNGGPYKTGLDNGVEIARGNVVGSELFGSFGEFLASGGETNHIIWPNGPYKIPPATGVNVDVVSTDPNDTLGGTGVNSIEIHWLDINLDPQSVIVEMNGTTPVINVMVGMRFTQCMHINITGTNGQGAVGEISAYVGLQKYSVISAGSVRCASSARMVPRGKRAMVVGLVGASVSGTAAAGAKISAVATELDNHQYTDQGLFIPFGSIGVQDGSEAFNLPLPVPFIEGTVIAMAVTVDKASEITGDWFGWLEDAA